MKYIVSAIVCIYILLGNFKFQAFFNFFHDMYPTILTPQKVQAAIGETINVDAPLTPTGSYVISANKFVDSANPAYYLAPAASTSLVVAGKVGIGGASTYPLDVLGALQIDKTGGLQIDAQVSGQAVKLYNGNGALNLDAPLQITTYLRYNEQSNYPTRNYRSVYYYNKGMQSNSGTSLFTNEFSWDAYNAPGSNNGSADWYVNWVTFNDGVTNITEHFVSSPKGWDGQIVTCLVNWQSGVSGNVRWEFRMRAVKHNSYYYDQTPYTALKTEASRANANLTKITLFEFTWPTGYDMVIVAFRRLGGDGADTMAGAASVKSGMCRLGMYGEDG